MQSFLIVLLFIAATWAQDISTAVINGETIAQDDPNIVIKNDIYDPSGSTWTWRYNTESESEPPHRDLGQSFTTHESFHLDKIYVEIENELTSPKEHLAACENAPFTLKLFEFVMVGDLEPLATVAEFSGTLPAKLDSNEIVSNLFTVLEIDIPNTLLEAEKVYAFLLCFDEMRDNQTLNLNKTHASDYYMEGAMLYRVFDGSQGRENVMVYNWSHPGGNPSRDLNVWIIKGEAPAAVAQSAPAQFKLSQNYPNPFNPSTEIEYTLQSPQTVKLQVFNSRGMHVSTVVNQYQSAGTHRIQFNAEQLPSGQYFYQLKTEKQILTRRMLLLK